MTARVLPVLVLDPWPYSRGLEPTLALYMSLGLLGGLGKHERSVIAGVF